MTLEEGRSLLATCGLHALLGLELVELEKGRASFRFAPPPTTRSGDGTAVHGGAVSTALDTAATFAVISSIGADAATVDLRVDYLRPALDAEFRVDGTMLRQGRRLAWAEATAFAADGRPVAVLRGTFIW